jgi:Sulfotransferase family/Methyltransferase domain
LGVNVPFAVDRIHQFYPRLAREQIWHRLWYSTYVNVDRRYMYFAVPKAGATAMKTLLHRIENLPPLTYFTGPRQVKRYMFIHDRRQFKLPSLIDFDDEMQEKILTSPEFFRFAIVRNPYSRLQSAWRDKVRACAPGYEYLYYDIKGKLPDGNDPRSIISFREFVQALRGQDLEVADAHWRLQEVLLFYRAINFSLIGHLECPSKAVASFLQKIGEKRPQDFAVMNESGISDEYDDELADLVYGLYKRDFDTFGYSAEMWRSEGLLTTARTSRAFVSEARHLAEVVERNIVIGQLYRRLEKASVKPEEFLGQYRNQPFSRLFDQHIANIEGWLTRDEAELLFNVARSVQEGCIVEIGAYRGRSTVTLALGSVAGSRNPVFAIEPHENFTGLFGHQFGAIDRGHFMKHMVEYGLFHIVRLINLSSHFLADSWPMPVGLIWIDGDHKYEAVARDFALWKGKLTAEADVVFHDAIDPESGPGRVAAQIVAGGEFKKIAIIGKAIHLKRHTG